MATTRARKQLALRKLLWVVPLTLVSVIAANSIIRACAVMFFGISETFQYLQGSFVLGSTIIFVLLALLAFLLVNRFTRDPIRFYRILALVALCISFLSPLMALTGQISAPGMNSPIFWTMIAMHIVSAIIIVSLLTTLTCRRHA